MYGPCFYCKQDANSFPGGVTLEDTEGSSNQESSFFIQIEINMIDSSKSMFVVVLRQRGTPSALRQEIRQSVISNDGSTIAVAAIVFSL